MHIGKNTTHFKIPQVVTGLLPQQCLNNVIVIMCGQTILFAFVSTILFSNDKATRLFMAVGDRGICIDRTTMFPVVDM